MSGFAILGWGAGLWLAAGVEAARGGGMPGPLLLTALAAGLWAGPRAGMVAGTAAGLCSAALFGGSVLVFGSLGLAGGVLAGVLGHWLSRRHLLVGLLTAVVVSAVFSLLLGWSRVHHPGDLALAALLRGGENALWMIAIYGIVLLASQGVPRGVMREY